ncbi:MAG: DNA translocase FtsK [Acidimicrobiales bacterium]
MTSRNSRARSGPGAIERSLDRILEVVGAQPDDAWGLLLVVGGVLISLGVSFHALGPAGSSMFTYGARTLGWGMNVVEVGLVVGGILLIAQRSVWRAMGTLGSVVALALSAAGLADLVGGNPPTSATWHRLGGAGGIFGSAIAGGLAKVIGEAGAGVVLGVVALAVCCWLLGARLAVVVRVGASGLWAGARLLARAAKTSLTGRPAPDSASPQSSLSQPVSAHESMAPLSLAPAPGYIAGGGGLGLVDDGALDEALGVGIASAALGGGAPGGLAGATGLEPPKADEADRVVPIVAGGMLAPGRGDADHAAKVEQLALPVGDSGGNWKLPPLKILKRSKDQAHDRKEVEARGRVLERALAAHGVETHLVGFTVGPTVTRFELELGAGVKVARVTNLAKDIAYAMASPDVRILAPIPGRSAIGVEVPNQQRQLVTLGDVLSGIEARRATHPLEVALGRDIAGRAVMVNLAEMPHILIAGATGAGKSSCINSVITSILMRATPDEVRLILVDPKRVELGQYNGLPHLLTQVVVNPKRAANALGWAVAEMERRYDLLAEVGMRDITGYNAAVDRGDFDDGLLADGGDDPEGDAAVSSEVDGTDLGGDALPGALNGEVPPGDLDGVVPQGDALQGDSDANREACVTPAQRTLHKMTSATAAVAVAESRRRIASGGEERRHQRLPFVLIVVDELNDLMMVAARDVEESICRIAQMARAVGIHLVIATQRPSVDVITGVIKANVPSRLAFSVSSLADSRVILDQPGAERLIGRGDLLLLTASSSVPRRLQGPWVSEEEVRAIAAHWRRQSGPRYLDGVEGEGATGPGSSSSSDDDDDELLARAMELVVRSQLGSTSMLQRKLRVGFARAGRLMDLLERRGVVGASEGSKARTVLMTPEELDQLNS